jgi:hypothetical protein
VPRSTNILATFAAARAVTATTVRAIDSAGWARFGTHATYGRLDIEGLLRLAVDRDENHLAGLVETLQPGRTSPLIFKP